MNSKNEIDSYLDALSEKVRRSVEVVTAKDIDQNYMLHISKNTNIRKFIPAWINNRQNPNEDRTVPRVAVAPTVLGCFIGYGDAHKDFVFRKSNGEDDQANYKGGWKIYALPFDVCLRPSKKLVQDVNESDEHWLIAYDKETSEYLPESAGKAFYHKIQYVGRSEEGPMGEGTLYVEVTKEEGIRFSKNLFLKKGHWSIEGPLHDHLLSWKDDKSFILREISKADYLSSKNATADLLGFSDKLPAYLNW